MGNFPRVFPGFSPDFPFFLLDFPGFFLDFSRDFSRIFLGFSTSLGHDNVRDDHPSNGTRGSHPSSAVSRSSSVGNIRMFLENKRRNWGKYQDNHWEIPRTSPWKMRGRQENPWKVLENLGKVRRRRDLGKSWEISENLRKS